MKGEESVSGKDPCDSGQVDWQDWSYLEEECRDEEKQQIVFCFPPVQ